jgi:hypothetical protein
MEIEEIVSRNPNLSFVKKLRRERVASGFISCISGYKKQKSEDKSGQRHYFVIYFVSIK